LILDDENQQKRIGMKKILILIAALAATFITAVPASAVVKNATWAYVAGTRSGTSVHINGLVHQMTSKGMTSPGGRTVYLQRNLHGTWQNMVARPTNSVGRMSVAFIQHGAFQYRLVVTATSTALAAISGVLPVRAAAPSSAGIVIANAYTTGYGWPDNSPPGAIVSGPSGTAGGTGTFANPITIAVGYVGNAPDYSYGTKFYIPNVRKYFVVQDTCAECHQTPGGASVWVDMWTGGNGTNDAAVLACEDAVTGNHTIIRNPDANRAVVQGALFSGTACTAQFGG
jgi:hypothetical protein